MSKTKAHTKKKIGTWEDHKQKLKEIFPQLNDSDLFFESGKSDDMFHRVLQKTGKTKKELAAIIATFIAENIEAHTKPKSAL